MCCHGCLPGIWNDRTGWVDKEDLLMSNKPLSYFMREELKEEEIVEVVGPDSILDEQGKPVVFKVKRLSQEHINKIYDNYRTEKIAMDKKRNQPYVVDGRVVMQEVRDSRRAYRHVLADALVYPDLRDEELMRYFDCVDASAMPMKVFTSAEYNYVAKIVNQVLGIDGEDSDGDAEDLDAAKN